MMNKLFYLVCTLFMFILGVGLLVKPNKPRIISEVQTEEEYLYEKFIDSILIAEENCNTTIKKIVPEKKKKIVSTGKSKVVTITKYNPTKEQCDMDPLVTADNSKIDLRKLNSGELRWIAVSRDLRKHFPYGSKVIIHSEDPEISGIWEVHDTMNERWKNRIDLLRPIGETKGKWKNIKISLAKERV